MATIDSQTIASLLESDHPLEKSIGAIWVMLDNMADEGIIEYRPELLLIGWHETKGMAVVPIGMEVDTDAVAALATAYLTLGKQQGLPLDALIGGLRAAAERERPMNRAGRRDQRPQRPRGARGRGKRGR